MSGERDTLSAFKNRTLVFAVACALAAGTILGMAQKQVIKSNPWCWQACYKHKGSTAYSAYDKCLCVYDSGVAFDVEKWGQP